MAKEYKPTKDQMIQNLSYQVEDLEDTLHNTQEQVENLKMLIADLYIENNVLKERKHPDTELPW